MTVCLATDRLLLRPHRAADAPRIYHWLSDFAVSGNLARVPYPYSLSDAARWLALLPQEAPPEDTAFAIEQAGELVGNVAFHQRGPVPEIGYWLARPFWGRGLMSEAVAAALGWYFATDTRRHLVSGVFAFNAPSLAIQQKMGFVVTGRSMTLCMARGKKLEHIDTELTEAAYRKART